MYKDIGDLQRIRIGDFSKLSRVSIKALRLYDEIGLLKSVDVDRFTGYRYYEFDQLPRLYRNADFASVALKDLGFSLEEIGRLLEGELSVEQMRGMLKLWQAEGGGGSGAPGACEAMAERNRTGGFHVQV